jgi:hypothetical protein
MLPQARRLRTIDIPGFAMAASVISRCTELHRSRGCGILP